MNLLTIVSAVAVFGIDFGWEPAPGGGIQYIVQIPPEQLDDWRAGRLDLSNDLPPAAGGVKNIRYVFGNERLPHQGETPPLALLPIPSTAGNTRPDNNAPPGNAPADNPSAARSTLTLLPESRSATGAALASDVTPNTAGATNPAASSSRSAGALSALTELAQAGAPSIPPILPLAPITDAERAAGRALSNSAIQPTAGSVPVGAASSSPPLNALAQNTSQIINPLTGGPAYGPPTGPPASVAPWSPTTPLTIPFNGASSAPSFLPGSTQTGSGINNSSPYANNPTSLGNTSFGGNAPFAGNTPAPAYGTPVNNLNAQGAAPSYGTGYQNNPGYGTNPGTANSPYTNNPPSFNNGPQYAAGNNPVNGQAPAFGTANGSPYGPQAIPLNNPNQPNAGYNDPRYGTASGAPNSYPPIQLAANPAGGTVAPYAPNNSGNPGYQNVGQPNNGNQNNPAYNPQSGPILRRANDPTPLTYGATSSWPPVNNPPDYQTAGTYATTGRNPNEVWRLPGSSYTGYGQPEPVQHWLPLMLALVALFLSIGGNAYLISVAWSQRERYDALADMLRDDRTIASSGSLS